MLLRALEGLDREARRRVPLPWQRYSRVFFAALVVVLGLVSVFEILYFPHWRASYYANIDLSGAPALVIQVPEATQNWGFSSPGAALPADNFSARFETCLRLDSPAHVNLTVGSDDGSRVFIDELPVFDAWHDQGFTQRQLSTDLEKGIHKIRLEYYEHAGGARLMFSGRIGDKDLTHSLRLPAANGACPR